MDPWRTPVVAALNSVGANSSRPVGAVENSPAIYRWGRREKALIVP